MSESRNAQLITVNRILIFLGILAGVIVIYKAATLSFTHDESASYLIMENHSIWQIFTDESAWKSANNHILNSTLYKVSTSIFGQNDFAMRLPNVLAFFGCLWIAFFIVRTKLSSPTSKFVFFAILFFNPFVLDFYSLCRGYGLSMFFHFGFLAAIWHFHDTKRISMLYIAYGCLIFACLSLLTSLVLFPTYTLALWITSKSHQFDRKHLKHIILVPIISGIIALLLLAKPILYLINSNEFEYGVASIWDSFKSVILSTFTMVSRQDFMWVYDVLTVVFLFILIYVLYVSIKQRKNIYVSVSVMVFIVLLHVLCFGLGIMFPVDRKVTIYIPILALLFANQINNLPTERLNRVTTVLSFSACILALLSNKLDRTTEWAYDRKTKDFILHVDQLAKNDPKVLLTEWWFNPSADYYIKTLKLKNIQLLPYDKKFDLRSKPDMVIAFTKEMVNNPSYRLVDAVGGLGLYTRR